ncbi:MAG: ATP-binding protein, partial [Clostridia bacterium]|nr:ATP-binding protein [Clostridia bacterium]
APNKGKAGIRIEIMDEQKAVIITFTDCGIPYNPLLKQDPDVTLSAEEREIGGLGIFMAKKTMDDVSYRYEDGKNILKLKKNL